MLGEKDADSKYSSFIKLKVNWTIYWQGVQICSEILKENEMIINQNSGLQLPLRRRQGSELRKEPLKPTNNCIGHIS